MAGILERGRPYNKINIAYSYAAFFSLSIKSKENSAVITRLVKEVKGLNPTFDAADIRGK